MKVKIIGSNKKLIKTKIITMIKMWMENMISNRMYLYENKIDTEIYYEDDLIMPMDIFIFNHMYE